MKKFPYLVLIIGSLLLATGCEKAAVVPEPSITTAQEGVSKDRGIEIRVTGTYDSKPFTATLRANTFSSVNTLRVVTSLEQVGGGLSRTDASFLESTPFTFDVWTLVHTPDTFSFTMLPVGWGGGKPVVLDTYYEVLINSDTRKYNQITGYLASISNLWEAKDSAGNYVYLTSTGSLNADGYTLLRGYYEAISTTVGRY
ncbi:hypothetical protein LJ737_20155 [Hymenobacter sp. 15J16-1T3B]|uniref:hypothetical protein n=1 Tax=Hymenobacter sp. 15J16-1T3B TaxID=2886941 RepID=UPI001D12B1BB|nr:hypothetical protein [Hymenobacter sp. 15J16-1T3B]MCC3159566.1 hypothetical protein [Hymenobacter sp. 15J16-1T3B]